MSEGHLGPSLILILACVAAVGVFTSLRMPAATGYLLAGLAIGPHGLGLFVAGEDTRFLAELGLVLLMFMVGLEFSLPRLWMAKRDVMLAGALQVGITLAVVAGALLILDFELRIAILLGGGVAMSSTAISLKQLAEQGELGNQHGRIVTFDRPSDVERIIHAAREFNAAMPCVVSASDDGDVGRLAAIGATVVFPENLAAGLGLADQALQRCGMSRSEAGRVITRLRAQLNPELRERVGV